MYCIIQCYSCPHFLPPLNVKREIKRNSGSNYSSLINHILYLQNCTQSILYQRKFWFGELCISVSTGYISLFIFLRTSVTWHHKSHLRLYLSPSLTQTFGIFIGGMWDHFEKSWASKVFNSIYGGEFLPLEFYFL